MLIPLICNTDKLNRGAQGLELLDGVEGGTMIGLINNISFSNDLAILTIAFATPGVIPVKVRISNATHQIYPMYKPPVRFSDVDSAIKQE